MSIPAKAPRAGTPLFTLALLATVLALGCLASSALGLTNPERAYEMVTPPYKGGFGATRIVGVASNGESVAFYSPGVFAGAPAGVSQNNDSLNYLARRSAAGWSTVPIMPPDELLPSVPNADISPTLGVDLAIGQSGPNNEAAGISPEGRALVHSTEAPDVSEEWQESGVVLKNLLGGPSALVYRGSDPRFCHLLVESDSREPLLESAFGEQRALYELNRGCEGAPAQLRLVGVNGKDEPLNSACKAVNLGLENYSSGQAGALQPNQFNAESSSGETVFFTTCVNNDDDHQLFVRLDGARTLEVSRPLSETCAEAPCPGAPLRPSGDFTGAAEDGSKVYFTTTAQLVPGDTDTSRNLYLAIIGCPADNEGCSTSEKVLTSMTRVSAPANPGEPAGVQGVVRLAPDGARVYFVATGELLSAEEQAALEAAGDAVPRVGADNLYVYDSESGTTAFVTELCSEPALSGAIEDSRCPLTARGSAFLSTEVFDSRLWTGTAEAQTAGPGGEFLVFSSWGRLTANDEDSAEDVYRFDALTGTLERVSIGEDGADANGNRENTEIVEPATQRGNADAVIAEGNERAEVREHYELSSRAISEDGSRIVFETAEPLSPSATNGLTNIYEWHKQPGWSEGKVSLISSGTAPEPADDAVIDPTGQNILFVTTASLASQDVDSASDVYDARVDGGFPAPPVPPEACSGDACQGPLTNPVPLLVPGSVSQAPGENLSALPVAKADVKRKAKVKKCSKGKKLSHGRCAKPKPTKKVKNATRKGRR